MLPGPPDLSKATWQASISGIEPGQNIYGQIRLFCTGFLTIEGQRADYLGRPLAKLAAEDLGYIEALLKETLERRTIITCVWGYFRDRAQRQQGEDGQHAR